MHSFTNDRNKKKDLQESSFHQRKSAIWEIWNHFDKEYCFELMKLMPERIKVVIKALGGAIKY